MKIYLVRHGETDANKNDTLQGQKQNLQLNEYGVREATKLKQKLQDVTFTACYTSPLVRAWSTAIILAGDRTIITEDKRLIERYLGNLEGEDRSKYNAKKYWDYQLNSDDEGVEKIQDVFHRCESFLEDIVSKHDDTDTILIVSHGAVVRALHHILKKTNRQNNLRNFSIPTCFCQKHTIKKEDFIHER